MKKTLLNLLIGFLLFVFLFGIYCFTGSKIQTHPNGYVGGIPLFSVAK